MGLRWGGIGIRGTDEAQHACAGSNASPSPSRMKSSQTMGLKSNKKRWDWAACMDHTCWRALEPRWRFTGRHAQRMLFHW
jgi:hypothetical protein